MDILDYRKQLGIGFNEKEKCERLTNIVFNYIEKVFIKEGFTLHVSDTEYFNFCNNAGIKARHLTYNGEAFFEILKVIQNHTNSIEDFLLHYVIFINCLDESKNRNAIVLLIDIISYSMKATHIQFDIFEDEGGYFIFPKGVEQFDKALISDNLLWLSEYSNSEKAWRKALRAYADSKSDNASDVADLFRKALETFFQDYFGGNKSLENYKVQYHAYLNEKGIPEEIAKNFELNLQQYTNYMNKYAKHRDATSDKALEYIMYQTGNIIRLLITLKDHEY